MKESKVLSIRLNADFYDSFNSFCARNNISKKTAFVRAFELVLDADKVEKKESPKFPPIPLPPL